MPVYPLGNSKEWGSAHSAVGKQDVQLAWNHIPFLVPGVPVLEDKLGCQIEHPPHVIVVGEAGSILDYLPELAV